MEILKIILYFFLFTLIAALVAILIKKAIKKKKLINILNSKEDETYVEFEAVKEKKENFFHEDFSIEDIKEHIRLLNKTKEEFLNSNSLDQEIEVDFVIASQVLKRWTHNSLLTEDNKIILKKEKSSFKDSAFSIEDNKTEEEAKTISNEENLVSDDTQIVGKKIDVNNLKEKVLPEEEVKKKSNFKHETELLTVPLQLDITIPL